MSEDAGDELPPARDHSGRNAALAIGLLGLAAGGAWYANGRNDDERRARSLLAASASWNDLARCLADDHWRVGEIAAVSRHRELSIPRSVRDLSEAERARLWPWRCATSAQRLTRALFESRSDEAAHRLLAQFASIAASDLARGALRTGAQDPRHYLDELFAAAARAELPTAPPSTVERPPEPLRYLDPRRVRPIFRGRGGSVVAAEQPLDDGALRVLVGRGEARLCDFDRSLDAPECVRVRALDEARRPALTAALYPRLPGFVTRYTDDALAVGALLHPGHPDSPVALQTSGALRVAQDGWIVASRTGDGAAARYTLGPGVTFAGAVTPPRVLGALVVAFADAPLPSPPAAAGDGGLTDAGTPAPDAGTDATDGGATPARTLLAGLVAESLPARWVTPPSPRGTLRSAAREALVRACRMGDTTAAVAYGDDGHALVLWAHRGAVSARPVDARPGAFACHDGRLRLGWYTNVPRPVVHVTTCTAEACVAAEGAFVFTETTPRLALAGDQVLAAYTQEGLEGLRYRFAPPAGLATAPEVVVFDDSTHGGVRLEAPPTALARGDAAVMLVTDEAARETWAIRVDARGYRALRPRE